MSNIAELKKFYSEHKTEIKQRLLEFKRLFKAGSDEDIFNELCFCLFTPQSKAKSCWDNVCRLKKKNLLLAGTAGDIAKNSSGVRFHNNKSRYVVAARKLFAGERPGKLNIKNKISEFTDVFQLRDWLVENVKGMGYKEASHFLRNIGLGDKLTILDRHILKNLARLNIIKKIPDTITPKLYLQIEHKMAEFSNKTGIPLADMDLLFWCRQTGKVFK